MRIPLGLTSLSWVTLWSSTSHWDIKGSRQISFPDEREEGLPQVDPFYSFPLCTRAWGLGLQSPFVTMKQQAWRWNTTCKRRQGIKIRKSYWPAMMGRQGHVPISGPMLGTGRIRVRKTETIFLNSYFSGGFERGPILNHQRCWNAEHKALKRATTSYMWDV